MYKLLTSLLLIIALALVDSGGQDTMYTRGGGYIVMPKYDSVQELKEANEKADTVIRDLEKIMTALKIKTDTVQ